MAGATLMGPGAIWPPAARGHCPLAPHQEGLDLPGFAAMQPGR